MTWPLALFIGAITFASRAVSVVLLPQLPERFRLVLDRMPVAIFAGLAAHSLYAPASGLADVHTLAAAMGALIVAPRRSLLTCLIAGSLGYIVGDVALRLL